MFIWLLPKKKIKEELFHKEWKALTIRTVMGCIAMWCVFTSLKMLPIAEATVLHFASPFFLAILSIYFLNEHVGKWRWGAIISGFIGVVIVLNPTLSDNIYGQIIALCAALIMAMNMTMIRSLSGRVSVSAMVLFLHVLGSLILAPFAIYEGFMPEPNQWFLLILAGITAGVGQALLNEAYLTAPTAFVSSFAYVQIIFITAIGYFVFQEIPQENYLLGSLIIVAAGVTIAVREYLLNKKNLIKDLA